MDSSHLYIIFYINFTFIIKSVEIIQNLSPESFIKTESFKIKIIFK